MEKEETLSSSVYKMSKKFSFQEQMRGLWEKEDYRLIFVVNIDTNGLKKILVNWINNM